MHKIIVIILTNLFAIAGVKAQDKDRKTRANLKAIYVYNFATLVDWPSKYKTGNFTIGVMGDDDLYDLLIRKYSSKSVGSQPMKIKKFVFKADAERCHIIFVGESKSYLVPALAQKFKAHSTLIVSEKNGMLESGSIINFIVRDNKQAYELSKTNASRHKLTVGKTLTNLASNIR